MGAWDSIRLGAGLAVQDLGNYLGIPETGWSERIAGRSTPSSVGIINASSPAPTQYDYSQAKSTQNISNPITNNPKPTGTLSNPNPTDPYGDVVKSTNSEGDAYLQSLNTQYDRSASELRDQQSQLGRDREIGLSNLKGAVDEYGNTINKQRLSAQESTAKNIQSAGSTAAQTQAKSRNVLRALGILSSSAAGDILSRPMTEFGTQKADLQQGLIQRTQELDDAFAQKTAEHTRLVAQLENQYSDLVGQIQRDLRFSERERADAIKTAQSAVMSRLSDIRTAQANWQNDINAAKQGLVASATGLGSYVNQSADTSKIASTGLSNTNQYNPQTKTASIFGDRLKKDQEPGGLSALTSYV